MRTNPAVWLIVVAVAIRVPLLFTGLTYSSDIWRQSDTASIARNFWARDPSIFQPAIDWGGSGPGYVESEFQLYPFVTAGLYRLAGGEHVWLGKLVALACTTGMLAAFWGLARRVVDQRVALIALGFVAFAPISLRYGTAFMPEAAVLAFYVWALLLFVRWLEEDRTTLLVGATAATAVALLVKPTAVHLGMVFAILLLQAKGRPGFRDRRLWLAAGTALTPLVAWTLHARSLHLRYGNTFGVISGGDRKFATLDTLVSTDFYTGVTRTEVLWVLGLGAVPFALLGLVVAVGRRGPAVLLAGAITVTLFYIVVAEYAKGPQGIQYHVYALPYAGLAVGLGADRVLAEPPGGRRWLAAGALAAAVLFVVATTATYLRFFAAQNQVYTECGAAVRAQVPADELVVVSSSSPSTVGGRAVNYQEPMIFYFGDHRGWSLPADRHRPEVLDTLRSEGARWFVSYDETLLRRSPSLKQYLMDESAQVGPGLDESCAIWSLTSTG